MTYDCMTAPMPPELEELLQTIESRSRSMGKCEAVEIIQELIDEMCEDCRKDCRRCRRGEALHMALNELEGADE